MQYCTVIFYLLDLVVLITSQYCFYHSDGTTTTIAATPADEKYLGFSVGSMEMTLPTYSNIVIYHRKLSPRMRSEQRAKRVANLNHCRIGGQPSTPRRP